MHRRDAEGNSSTTTLIEVANVSGTLVVGKTPIMEAKGVEAILRTTGKRKEMVQAAVTTSGDELSLG